MPKELNVPSKGIFVDTNVLVYAFDQEAGEKHRIANQKLMDLWKLATPPSISVQVLQEFYVNLLKKGVPQKTSEEILREYSTWDVVDNDKTLLFDAIEVKERFHLSFWDALIIAAAKRAKASVIWSEDLGDQQDYGGVVCMNPLTVPSKI